jgi:hypothetical protein
MGDVLDNDDVDAVRAAIQRLVDSSYANGMTVIAEYSGVVADHDEDVVRLRCAVQRRIRVLEAALGITIHRPWAEKEV